MRGGWQGMMLAAAMVAMPAGMAAQAVEATDDNDRAVHAFVSAVDMGEVQQSMLAVERATNPEVRTFAQMMIRDHTGAFHNREMVMQTENSGLVRGMAMSGHTTHGTNDPAGPGTTISQASAHGAVNGAGTGGTIPAGGHPNSPSDNQRRDPGGTGTSVAQASGTGAQGQSGVAAGKQNNDSSHAGHNMSGMGNAQGGMNGGMNGMPAWVTPEMVQQLETTLREHPMSRPVMDANARNMAVLQGVNGPQFDVSYMDAQIGAHRYALSNIDRMLGQQGTLGDDIRRELTSMRAAVASHLQMAEQIRGRLQQ